MFARLSPWLVLFLLTAATLTQSGCTSAREQSESNGETEPATIEVDNRRSGAVVVYAVRSGQSRRIGRVNGVSTEVLRIPRGLVFQGGTPLRFRVDFLGAERPPLSRELYVYPGDRIELTVPAF